MTLPSAHFEPEFAPIELLPILVPALLYWWRAQHLAQRGRPVPEMSSVSTSAGHTSTNLGSLYKGMVGDTFQNFKHLRKTASTHNPLDDAMGNAEALLEMKKMGLKIAL